MEIPVGFPDSIPVNYQMVKAIYEEIKSKSPDPPDVANLDIDCLAETLIYVTIGWLQVRGYLDTEKINTRYKED